MESVMHEQSLASANPGVEPNLDQLEARLEGQLSGRVRDLHLLVSRQGVVLRGSAHSYYAKQLAQHALMRVTQLPILANEIEVL
jgi:hypothetical protein